MFISVLGFKSLVSDSLIVFCYLVEVQLVYKYRYLSCLFYILYWYLIAYQTLYNISHLVIKLKNEYRKS